MDLSVLHPVYSPERNYQWKDKLNSLIGHVSCRFLEWSGWYNQDVPQRLLGHYRLYQVFKQNPSLSNHLSLPLAYIINYRASHGFKYALSRITASIYYVFSLGERYSPFQIEGINRLLVYDKGMILQQFLEEAEEDFSSALRMALRKIASTDFLKGQSPDTTLVLQNKNEFNQYQTISHHFNEYNQGVSNGIKGKEKGVFSKKQLLILFDLLAGSKMIDQIDYSKPNKFEAIASLLQAVSAKSKDSFVEQLKDVHNNGLYSFNNLGELNQLIIIITNLADTFRKAGFRSIANIADKKIRELEIMKNNMD